MKDRTYFKIGLFVLASCGGIDCRTFISSAPTRSAATRFWMETYIDESVQGLNIGSEVLHRGVTHRPGQKNHLCPAGIPR